MTAETPLYIEFVGQKYVRLDHAIDELDASTKDALEIAAVLVQRYPLIETAIAEQAANDIRSLKSMQDDKPIPKTPDRGPHWPLPSFDAQDWACEFCRIAKDHGHNLDEGWVLGWFANALMRGYDEGVARSHGIQYRPPPVLPDGSSFFVGWNFDIWKLT